MTTTAQILDALLAYRTGYAGQRWNFREVLGSSGVSSGAGIGQGVNLTYSFPATLPAYWAPPPGQAPYYTNFTALNTIQADAARSVFAHYAAVTNLVFAESASTGNANIAIGRTTNGFGPGVGG